MNVLKQCIRNKKFLLSAVILVPLLFVALFGNFLISHDPLEIHYTQTLDAPSAEYPMGTDEYGRCIACRLIVGLQPTMIVAFGGTVIAMVAGSLLGLLAGYIKDAWGNAIMRVVDIILCFPSILLAMLVVGFWGSGMLNLVIVVGILYTPHFCRIAYSSTRKLRRVEYVESQQLLGASTFRILVKTLAQHCLLPDYPVQPDRVQRHPAGERAELPGAGRGAAQPLLGTDDRRRPGLYRHQRAVHVLALPVPVPDHFVHQPDGRRPAGRAGSQAEEELLRHPNQGFCGRPGRLSE